MNKASKGKKLSWKDNAARLAAHSHPHRKEKKVGGQEKRTGKKRKGVPAQEEQEELSRTYIGEALQKQEPPAIHSPAMPRE